jgi:hypothetical protein
MLAVPRGSFVPPEHQGEAWVDSPIRVRTCLSLCSPNAHAVLHPVPAVACCAHCGLLRQHGVSHTRHEKQLVTLAWPVPALVARHAMPLSEVLLSGGLQVEEHDFNISAPHM